MKKKYILKNFGKEKNGECLEATSQQQNSNPNIAKVTKRVLKKKFDNNQV